MDRPGCIRQKLALGNGCSVFALGFYDQKIAWIRLQIGLAPVRISIDDKPAPHTDHVRGELERSASLGDFEQHICAVRPYKDNVVTTTVSLFVVATPTEKTGLAKFNSQKRAQNRPANGGDSSVLRSDFSVIYPTKGAKQKYEPPSYEEPSPDPM